MSISTVLCAVDDSSHASAVAYAAGGLAQFLNAQLIILRVKAHPADDSGEAFEDKVRLNELVSRALPGGIGYREATESVVSTGEPAEVIVRMAAARDAGLIVMG